MRTGVFARTRDAERDGKKRLIPWVLIDTAPIPGSAGTLRLMRRGAEFLIWLGPVELMNSRLSGSEEALATLTCGRLRDQARPTVLIGGLGMGFTLRAALAALGPEARIVVAELVPAVVAWGRGPMGEIFAGCLDDLRVRIMEGDVGIEIRSGTGIYDAILLDVDNGPAGQTRDSNGGLYSARGLASSRMALKPGGLLAVWSVAPDAAFAARMAKAGFMVDEIRIKANAGKRGARHVIWIGQRR